MRVTSSVSSPVWVQRLCGFFCWSMSGTKDVGRLFVIGGRATINPCQEIEEYDLTSTNLPARSATFPLTSLPRDVQWQVLGGLSAFELLSVTRVCKLWSELSHSEVLWQRLCAKHGICADSQSVSNFRSAFLTKCGGYGDSVLYLKYRRRLLQSENTREPRCVLQ